MKAWTASTLASLASGRIVKRDLLSLFLAEGTFRFALGVQGTPSYGGNPYVGSGKCIRIERLTASADLSAKAVVAYLNAVPNSALTPDVVASIEAYTWHQKPVTIDRAYFDPDTRAILSAERWFTGIIDRTEHNEKAAGDYAVAGFFESRSRDHLKTGYRRRSDSDQRRINVSDGGLRYAATVGQQELIWGRRTEPKVPGAEAERK